MSSIDWPGWLVWGFASTIVLTTMMAASQGLGITRMNIPYILGSMFTPDRDRARLVGLGVHIANGWLFSLVYVLVLHAWGGASWWKGGVIGSAHAAFVLSAVMPVLPAMHPRMASEAQGPTQMRQLEPPGFFALHYGARTPIVIVVSHIVFGIVVGAFCSEP